MRVIGLLIAATVLAGVAHAEPDATPAKPAAAPGKTVEGLTITARPFPAKACSSRDKDCLTRAVAALKRDYPQELKAFCFQWKAKAARTQFTNEQLLESLAGNGPPTPTAFGVNSAVEAACGPDRK